jgi:glucose-6-phosphate 1-epimerase
MHTNSLDQDSIHDLEKIIASCDFIKLSGSKDVYPQAPGSGLPLLCLNTELCSATISLQGAQLLEFKTTTGAPLLWVSPNCDFTPGIALRGGIPLCLPWFGTMPGKPKHGFARNNFWQLANAHRLPDGNVELEFLFVSYANPLFPYDFSAELRMTLGKTAKLELTINNTDNEDFDCSWVMHNYFPVRNLGDVCVQGLANCNYNDSLDNNTTKYQQGDLKFPGAVDRIYPNINNTLHIIGTPAIEINHNNCPSVVTWNPGSEAAASIADIGANQEQFYICVERGAVQNEQWHLVSGSSQTAWMEIKETP